MIPTVARMLHKWVFTLSLLSHLLAIVCNFLQQPIKNITGIKSLVFKVFADWRLTYVHIPLDQDLGYCQITVCCSSDVTIFTASAVKQKYNWCLRTEMRMVLTVVVFSIVVVVFSTVLVLFNTVAVIDCYLCFVLQLQ